LANHGSNFHQIIMDSISTPLASMGSVVGWAYVIFNSLLWFFGVHGSLALTALDNGIMTPWALENIALYNQYGSVDAAIAAGKQFHFWAKPMLDSYILLGGSGATLGLIIAIFIAHAALIIVRWRNWRCRQASSRLTNRFCLVCRSS
jgi:PTS system cellobiose-specific IIC component